MRQAGPQERSDSSSEIIDFDEALLDSCSTETKRELLTEATLLAAAFAPEGNPESLRRMAERLSTGSRETGMDRAHARKLAAALKRLAQRS
jgi:hypothetical protein